MSVTVANTRGWVWNPAGPDDLLARACEELKSGRFGLARDALRGAHGFEERSRRSALLASVAAGADAVDHWAIEEPDSRDALLLAARVAVVRARRATDTGLRDAKGFALEAVRACAKAAAAYPQDPTPWVALLMLIPALRAHNLRRPVTIAQGREAFEKVSRTVWRADQPAWNERVAVALAGGGPVPAGRPPRGGPVWRVWQVAEELERTLVLGPWDVMFAVWARDPLNREAYHRMLECLSVNDGYVFASLVANATRRTEALQLLPLAAILADYRWRVANPKQPGEDRPVQVWGSPTLRGLCRDLYEGWFTAMRAADGVPPVADYSLLAHALVMVGERVYAAQVIEAAKPFASTYPWSVTSGGPGDREFARVTESLGVSPPRAKSGWELRELHGT